MTVVRRIRARCSHCRGIRQITCPNCCGKGYVPCFRASIVAGTIYWCFTCRGTGKIQCPHCLPVAAR